MLARNISTGQKFARGDELYRIADLRRVWVLADVFGAEAEHVKPGAFADVSVPEPRQVETGWRFGGRVQIVEGLAAGDRVVVAATFLLNAERRLRLTTSAASLR